MKVSDPLGRILRESSSLKSTAGDKDGDVTNRLILLCIYGCRRKQYFPRGIHLPIQGSSAAVSPSPIRYLSLSLSLSLSRLFFFFRDRYNG